MGNKGKLIHEDLTYTIRGVLFDIHNELGPNLPEKFYQEAVGIGLEEKGVAVQLEKEFQVLYRGNQVGRYYVDAWLEGGKVLLELKVAAEIEPIHEAQAISYLKVTNADLAIIANFGQGLLDVKRLPNFLRNRQSTFAWQPQPTSSDLLFPELVQELLHALHGIHDKLGPGFLHQVYRRAVLVELREQEIGFQYIQQTPIYYRNHYLGDQASRLIDVEGKVLLAAVAVRDINEGMKAQLKARMRHHGFRLGLLANFHEKRLVVKFVRQDE